MKEVPVVDGRLTVYRCYPDGEERKKYGRPDHYRARWTTGNPDEEVRSYEDYSISQAIETVTRRIEQDLLARFLDDQITSDEDTP